mmetsp:Transcript_4772/g.7778  ORF Transcript_4772/g.7778 Transcript_4772/m.7778 type:complete len:119 (+) Transcript_4772:219-575(+)
MAAAQGPRPEQFPRTMSSVPVEWTYFGKKFPIQFHAGCVATARDSTDSALKPVTRWGVTHDKPTTREAIEAYYAALTEELAHTAKDDGHYGRRQWRLKELHEALHGHGSGNPAAQAGS